MKQLIFLFALLIGNAAMAQIDTTLGVDSLFLLGRKIAFDGNRDSARQYFDYCLKRSPNYHDIRVFKGRTLAWDKQYPAARKEFSYVLSVDSAQKDCYYAWIDMELWDAEYDTALYLSNRGLKYHPKDAEMLTRKAAALDYLGYEYEALGIVDTLKNPRAIRLKNGLRNRLLQNNISVNYASDHYSDVYGDMYYAYVQGGYRTKYGSVIGRVNYARRFGDDGYQVEFDAYPRIADGIYAYVNYGYSASDVFPLHRAGGELHASLPKSFEASAGFRYLYFGGDSKVLMYTGSIGKYWGNNWFSFRPFITPSSNSTSMSGSIIWRRYFSDPINYLGLRIGIGFSPEEKRIQTGLGSEIAFFRSQTISLDWQQKVSQRWIVSLGFQWTRQELTFAQDEYVQIWSPSANVRYLLWK